MNRQRLLVLLGMALTVGGAHTVAAIDCGSFVRSVADCVSTEWQVHSSSTIESEEDLYRLQEEMQIVFLECAYSIPQFRGCGCNEDILRRAITSEHEFDFPDIELLLTAGECLDQCLGRCSQRLHQRFLEMIYRADSPAIRWGAIYYAIDDFEYGEVGALLDACEKASVYVLTQVDDSVSRLFMLDAMYPLDLDRATVVSALVDNMSHDSALVRLFSFQLFREYTECPITDGWPGDTPPTDVQVEAIRAWWRGQTAGSEDSQ